MNGIPILQNISARSTGISILGAAQAQLWKMLAQGNWGIYVTGQGGQSSFAENATAVALSTPIGNTTIGDLIGGSSTSSKIAVQIDSLRELDYRKETQVSDYRLETGSFASYNKVRLPDMVMISLTRGGNQESRKVFMTWLENNVNLTSVFDIVTPEIVYKNMTLEAYEIRRTAKDGGASLIVADCMFRKILNADPIYYSTKPASTANAQSANDVPTTTPQRVVPAVSRVTI